MKNIKKIVGINLLILLVVMSIAFIFSWGTRGQHLNGIGFMMLSMIVIAVQVIVNLIIAIVHFTKKEKELGKAYLLAVLVIAVIGASGCFGGSTVL